MDGVVDKLKKIRMWIFISSIVTSPVFLCLFAGAVVILILIGGFGEGGSDGRTCVSMETVDEKCSSITVAGHGTMSVDEYVAGVLQHEFNYASDETLKAQAIAARSYGVHGADIDDSGNCYISNISEGFQTFDPNYTKKMLEISELTSGMVMIDENGKIARTEYSSNSLPEPYSSYGDIVTVSERNLEIPRSWWEANNSCNGRMDSLNGNERDSYGRPVYGCGHGRGMGQIAAWYLEREKGYTYEQILDFFYGADSEYNFSLASTKGATTNCISSNNGKLQALSSYTLKHAGLSKLNRVLNNSEKNKLEDYIEKEVDDAGYGTGEAVATAAQSLVYGLEQYGFYLGYYWGGDRTSLGVGSEWGKNKGYAYTDMKNPTGPEYGMDCSGFVSWAIRNACDSSFSSLVASGFVGLGKSRSSLKDAKPGDVLANSGHVILIVKNNGDGTVIAAEESFSYGLIFNNYSSISQYTLVDMSNFYNKQCKDSR